MKRFIFPVLVVLLLARPALAQHSQEEARRIASGWYERFLGRAPDAAIPGWADQIEQQWLARAVYPVANVLSQLLASPEYYQKSGGTPAGFVNHLHRDLTGRPASEPEIRYWANRLYREPRANVALAMLQRYSPGDNDRHPSWERYRDRDRDYDYHRPHQRNWDR